MDTDRLLSLGDFHHLIGLSIPGMSAYDNLADEYQSPSFHAVKKRLVFTHDSSDVEADQEDIDYKSQHAPQQRSTQQRKGVSGSPALDRLLNATNEKSVMKARAAAAPPLITVASSKSRTTTNPTGNRRAIDQGSSAAIKSRRSLGIPKAFDFGGDIGLTDEADYGSDSRDDNDNENSYRTPPQATKTAAKSMNKNMARTPAEFKRVSKIASALPSHADSEDRYGYDDPSYHEAEALDQDDDRLRFSDEDEQRAGRYAEQDDEDDEDQDEDLSRHRRVMAPVQQKRTASAKSAQTASRRKIPADTITSSSVNLPKKQPAPKKKVEKVTNPRRKAAAVTEQTDDDQDEGEVPSSQSSSRKTKAATAAKAISKATEARRHYESAQELVLEEVPVVPEVATEETGGNVLENRCSCF